MSLTLSNSFTSFHYNNIREIIPFLLERKYCFNTGDSRDGTKQSKYNYLQHPTKPRIEKVYGGNFIEPDTALKMLVNKFTDFINSKLEPLQTESALLRTSISNSKNYTELKKEKTKDINNLNEELNTLNNRNFINKRSYQQNHFSLNYYKFVVDVIINSLIFIAAIFAVFYLSKNDMSILSPSLGLIINIVLMTMFALYLVLNLNSVNIRNKSNWNQIYFRSMSNTADTV